MDLRAGPKMKSPAPLFQPEKSSGRIRTQKFLNGGITQNTEKGVLGRGWIVTGVDGYRPIKIVGGGYSKCVGAGRAA